MNLDNPSPGDVVEMDRTVRYGYDPVGRVTRETVEENGVAVPLETQYVYDASGSVSEMIYPSGLHLIWTRDPATQEVTGVTSATGVVYAYGAAHLPGGPVKGLTFGNGQTLLQAFNKRYEPVAMSSGPVSLGYGMTPAGDVASITEGATTKGFQYDFLDRLAKSPDWLLYGYDNNGNRTSETVGGVTASYAYGTGKDQLDYRSGPDGVHQHGYGYDYQSNLTMVMEYGAGGTTVKRRVCLRHDALGRMVLVGDLKAGYADPYYCSADSYFESVAAHFKYDARNRRIARQNAASGQWTYIVSDGMGNPLSELALVAGAWVPVRDYVWLDGKPLAQVEYVSGTQYAYYYHLDHIGLPRALTNQNGTMVWSATARPYGDIVESTTPDPISGRTVVTNLRLPGQYDERLLGSLGLQGPYYNWNRWYLPGVGRYLEIDPIAMGGGLNGHGAPDWYSYALANPLSFTDPRGLCLEDACVIEGTLVIMGATAAVAAWENYVQRCTATGTCPWSPTTCSKPYLPPTSPVIPTTPITGTPDFPVPPPFNPGDCGINFNICKGVCAGTGGSPWCYTKCTMGLLMCLSRIF